MSIDPERYREHDPRSRLIVALDSPDRTTALRLVDQLGADLRWVKVGLELFTAAGPALVEDLVARKLCVFLDLKLHDIPATMAGATRSAWALGARFCTVHAAAGAGIEAAVLAAAALDQAEPSARELPLAVLAVTVLTSHDAQELAGLLQSKLDLPELVLHLGRAAIAAGATGLVASPIEAAALRESLGDEPLLVTPGIRPRGSAREDQSRVATPTQALQRGADFLVVGRPITKADDPRAALGGILDEISAAL